MAKDLFSTASDQYARFRPTYPQEMFDHILSFVKEKDTAWDCATGNGQAAATLADHFKTVIGTEISQPQLDNAVQKDNIRYAISPAEETPFQDDTFDLITVATAYHWFNHAAFFREASRVGKKDCVVAVWSYTTLYTPDEAVNALYQHFYDDITAPYWEPERKFVDEKYRTVPFEFEPLPVKSFTTVMQWDRDDLLGYLGTWSAVSNYRKKHGSSPLDLIKEKLYALWPQGEMKEVSFPLSMRIGKVVK